MLNPFNPTIDRINAAIVDWWHAHPALGLLAALLLAGVITAAALALTVAENRRAENRPVPDLADTDTAILRGDGTGGVL